MPELIECKDYICPVDAFDLQVCAEECEFQDHNCDANVNQLANILMAENGF